MKLMGRALLLWNQFLNFPQSPVRRAPFTALVIGASFVKNDAEE